MQLEQHLRSTAEHRAWVEVRKGGVPASGGSGASARPPERIVLR